MHNYTILKKSIQCLIGKIKRKRPFRLFDCFSGIPISDNRVAICNMLNYFLYLHTSCFSCFFSNKRLQIRGGKTRFLKHVHPLKKLLEPLGQYTAPILPPV